MTSERLEHLRDITEGFSSDPALQAEWEMFIAAMDQDDGKYSVADVARFWAGWVNRARRDKASPLCCRGMH